MSETEKKRHACYEPRDLDDSKSSGFGPAITDCSEDENGRFEVGNGEYGSYVNFCPYCGEKAPLGIPLRG